MSEKLTWEKFAQRYCERQESTPDKLLAILKRQQELYKPVGWMMLECQDMSSTRMGSLVILPYGPNNTYKEPPTHPVSPSGRVSDMSVVVAILPTENLA